MIRNKTLSCLENFRSCYDALATPHTAGSSSSDTGQPVSRPSVDESGVEALPADVSNPDEIAVRLRQQVSRFRLWSASIGVLAKDRASLDYRLRETPDIAEQIGQMLDVVVIRLTHSRCPATRRNSDS